jgi:hypothetical protein
MKSQAINLLYNRQAIARMFNVAVSQVKILQVWWKVCLVSIKGQRATFVSKLAFKKHFVDFRKNINKFDFTLVRSDRISKYSKRIDMWNGCVKNEVTYSRNYIELNQNTQVAKCSCDDFKAQVAAFGKGCCKHMYLVLSSLGFNSLHNYMRAKR